MEPSAVENGLIRLVSGAFALVSAIAVFVTLIVLIFYLGAFVSIIFGPTEFSWVGVYATVWSISAVITGAYNFAWSVGNLDAPHWRPLLKLSVASAGIVLVSPLMWFAFN